MLVFSVDSWALFTCTHMPVIRVRKWADVRRRPTSAHAADTGGMTKHIHSFLIAFAAVFSLFVALPAGAQDEPPPPEPPEGWTCNANFYGTADGCDCGCGVVDPDCEDTTIAGCGFNGWPLSAQCFRLKPHANRTPDIPPGTVGRWGDRRRGLSGF